MSCGSISKPPMLAAAASTTAATLGRRGRQHRRRWPPVLDVLEYDRRVEDRGVAVDQRRHLEARVERPELPEVAAGERRDLGLERDALLGERDLHLLRVGGQRMLVELHHGRD